MYIYVGNYNSRVREHLWKRVTETVGNGEATMCFACRNEIGYSFSTYNTERQVVDFDGIPLVLIPENNRTEGSESGKQLGFSNASKYHQATRRAQAHTSSILRPIGDTKKDESPTNSDIHIMPDLVFLDIETTGLDVEVNEIIEIGALKVSGARQTEFHRLIRADIHIPDFVRNMTGIDEDLLVSGKGLETIVNDIINFTLN